MLNVLYQDNHCLAVEKPARLLTMPDRTGDASLLDLAKEWLRATFHKPGNVYLGLLHRLDRPVSGVVLFARTSKAAARLSRQFRDQTVQKVYRAVVEGRVPPGQHLYEDWLLKEREANMVRLARPHSAGAKPASLLLSVLGQFGAKSLVELRPATGRAHQIRVQLAARGHPIVGDLKYGAKRGWGGRIALHACELSFEHPVSKKRVSVRSEPPPEFQLLTSGA